MPQFKDTFENKLMALIADPATGAPGFSANLYIPDMTLNPGFPAAGSQFDLTPVTGSMLLGMIDPLPDDGFFDGVTFKGAFAPGDNWLKELSWLDQQGMLVSEGE